MTTRRRPARCLLLAVSVLLAACAADAEISVESAAETASPITAGGAERTSVEVQNPESDVRPRLAVGASWHWQLQGDLNTSHDVAVYDVDLFDVSEAQIRELRSQGR